VWKDECGFFLTRRGEEHLHRVLKACCP
jgi:hypothetical protein